MFPLAILGHLAGDYLFQTTYEALNKTKGRVFNRALMAHCVKYTLCFLPLFLTLGISLLWLIPIFVTHVIFDRRTPIIWWRKNVTRCSDEDIKNTFWLTVVIDQIFHIVVLAVISLVC